MNDISLKSDNGKYDIILRNFDKGIIIIDIKEKYNDSVIEEAIEIARKYNPERLVLKTSDTISSMKEYRKDILYKNSYELTKSYKEIKLKEIEIKDRDDLISLINYNRDITYKYIDQIDSLELIKNYKSYFFMYKDKKIGCIIFSEDEIKYFICNNILAYDMCLSKALYKIGHDTAIVISSLENTKINKFKNFGFVEDIIIKNYYEV